ncbi:UNVERIFIED_CONTAM: hypothetical protein GTU68_007424 [Idotea baltica]|nr:hypothetical protein [Idotea baltica]
MSTLLAIDTATESCSVALWYKEQVFVSYEVIPRLHAQRLLPMIQEVLAQADISLNTVDILAFGRGPGAFTGVRIATAAVQGLAFSLNCPVIAVSDLSIIAQRAYREYGVDRVVVAIDARMDEVYWGCYQLQENEMCLIGNEQISVPEKVCLPEGASIGQWFAAGTGWNSYSDRMQQFSTLKKSELLLPHAQDLIALALCKYKRNEIIKAEEAQPVYLRNKVATPKSIKLSM